jgi:RNA polymerase sigma-70 factor (ECF subfamily)
VCVLSTFARTVLPLLACADPVHVRWSSVPVTRAENSASRAMARYARGEDEAFGEVYDGLAERLLRYLRRLTRNEATAEDLVQQTFLRMHAARARFRDGSDVVPWAYAIARRVFLDHARRAKRHVLTGDLEGEPGTPPSPLPDAEAILSALEISSIVKEEVAEMPPVLREAFVLVREEEMSMAQAAETLGVSVAAMKVRAHRAYERLRDALTAEGIDRERMR